MRVSTDYCAMCGKKMANTDVLKRGRGYDGNGFFCTLRCGYYYAIEILRNDDFRLDEVWGQQ